MIKQFSFFKSFRSSLVLFNLLTFGCLADVSVKLNKTKIGMNESFSLHFTSPVDVVNQPDFSPLLQDFQILSSSQSRNIAIINGHTNQETQWNLVLTAKSEGTHSIPSIQFDNDFSPPLQIEVSAAKLVKNDHTLFIETEISPKDSAYDRTQILYTVRLYRSINLGQATLSDPVVNDKDAIIERVGKENEYEYYHSNGTRYIVFERKYAIFPQHVGELIFSPIHFAGQIIQGNSFFNMQTELKRFESETQQIEILPIPTPFNRNNWFAAYNVKISEEWSSTPNQIMAGEPITWTLTIQADGCLSSLIPDIHLDIPHNIKQYRDKAEMSNQQGNSGVLGTKQIKIALIANQEGEIQLPKIEVKWWDLNTNEIKIAHLAPRIIHVQNDPLANKSVAINDEILSSVSQKIPSDESLEVNQTLPWWAWALMSLNFIWMTLLAVFLYKKETKKIVKPKSPHQSLKEIKSSLKKACLANNPKQAELFFLAWAAIQFPLEKSLNLVSLKKHLSEPLQIEMDQLYNNLYGRKRDWNGLSLWEAFQTFTPPVGDQLFAQKPLENLEGLYN